MVKKLERVGSYQVQDLEDWHSFTGSDEEAYRDCEERHSCRNSVVSGNITAFLNPTFTPNTGCVSPAPPPPEVANIQDADDALEHGVPDPVEEDEGPAERERPEPEDQAPLKRPKAAIPVAPASSKPPAKVPSAKARRGVLRPAGSRTPSASSSDGTGQADQPAGTTAANATLPGTSVQVRIVSQQDGTVKLAVQPAIFYFGNVVHPDQHSASASAPPEGHPSPDRADDPSNKDQTKDTRRADSTTRKSVGFFKRLFSGLRGSNGGSGSTAATPEPVTAQQLGLKLLANAEPATITAGRDTVMAAGFVQAAPAENAGSPAATAAASSPARGARYPEDAAAAAHRLSTDIFRNVINAAAMVSPKASPRDTAFPTRTPGKVQQRDQQEQPAAAGAAAAEREGSQPATPSRGTSNDGASSHAGSPDDKHAGLVALLTGCIAEDPVAESAAAGAPAAAAATTAEAQGVEQEAGQLQPAGASREVSEGGGLPMPLLEKCDSPLVDTRAGGFADEVQPVASSSGAEGAAGAAAAAVEPAAEQEAAAAAPAAMTAAATAAPAAAVSPAAASVVAAETAAANSASPRTVGRRAYGTVANVVKKLIPSFRDSAATTSVSASANGAPTSPAAAGSVTAAARERAACATSGSAAAAPADAAAAAIPAEPVAAEQVDVQVGKEVAAAAAAVAAAAAAAPAAVSAAAADPSKATEAAAKVIDAASAAAVKQVQDVEQQGAQAAKALTAEAGTARSMLPPRGPSAPTAAVAADGETAAADGLEGSAAAGATEPQASPDIFVFGQEHPIKAGPSKVTIKPRSSRPSAAASPKASDAEDGPGSATRKRKSDVELLPGAPGAKQTVSAKELSAVLAGPSTAAVPEAVASAPEAEAPSAAAPSAASVTAAPNAASAAASSSANAAAGATSSTPAQQQASQEVEAPAELSASSAAAARAVPEVEAAATSGSSSGSMVSRDAAARVETAVEASAGGAGKAVGEQEKEGAGAKAEAAGKVDSVEAAAVSTAVKAVESAQQPVAKQAAAATAPATKGFGCFACFRPAAQ